MELQSLNIGSNIAALRKEKGLTQEQLASIIGVSAPAVSKWETGNSYPDITLLCPLARDLGTHVDTLLQFEDQELIPAMEKEGYHTPLKPKDLILGYSGAHSSFMKTFKSVAQDCGVDLYRLIVETSKLDRKSPSEELMRQVAAQIKEVR